MPKPSKPKPSKPLATEAELEAIRAFARLSAHAQAAQPVSCAALRLEAVRAFEAFLRRSLESRLPTGDLFSVEPVEIKFMSEILNPCPDLMLRATYRKEIVGRPKG